MLGRGGWEGEIIVTVVTKLIIFVEDMFELLAWSRDIKHLFAHAPLMIYYSPPDYITVLFDGSGFLSLGSITESVWGGTHEKKEKKINKAVDPSVLRSTLNAWRFHSKNLLFF